MQQDFEETKFDYARRIAGIQKKLSQKKINALVLAAAEGEDANIRYFTGDASFPSYCVITPQDCTVYSFQPSEQFSSFAQTTPFGQLKKDLKKIFSKQKAAIDLKSRASTRMLWIAQSKKLPRPQDFTIELLKTRMKKDANEIKCIKQAQKITLQALAELENLKEKNSLYNKTENHLAGIMEKRARELGASLDAFPPLVQAGARASVFHNNTSNAKAKKGEVLLADVGARFNGYCGDATRTFYQGNDKQTKDAMNAVMEAKKAAQKKARHGVMGSALAKEALNVLREYGFEKDTFKEVGLSIGHFTGLEVHDGVSLEKTVLEKGMCFTIEPGIYVPKKFGVRFEDLAILE